MSELTHLIQALAATDDPVEKSAISAEFAIDRLPPPIAELARSCAILRWFDEPIIAALLPLVAEQSDGSAWDAGAIYSQIAGLTFVEHLAWGKVYHSQTAEGLIAKYGTTEPERFRAVAALAAPAYLVHPEGQLAQSEALYCYLMADQHELAHNLLGELALAASRREDWHRVLAYYQVCDQVAEFTFVTPFVYNATDYFTRALAAHEVGDLKIAVADYGRAIQLDPEDADTYNNRGNAYGEQEYYDQAIADYNRAIQLKPEDATAYYNRGNAYREQSHYDQAIADYDRAIQLKPEYAAAYNNRGIAYSNQGQYTEAIANYSQAIRLDSMDKTVYYNRGVIYRKKVKYAEALTDFDQAIQLDPEYAAAYNNRGNTYAEQGLYTEAIADYDRAIQLNPDYNIAHDNRDITYSRQSAKNNLVGEYNVATRENKRRYRSYTSQMRLLQEINYRRY